MPRARGLDALMARQSGATSRLRLSPDLFRPQEGPGGGQGAAPLVRTIDPPWVRKLPMSQDFNRNVFDANLLAGAGSVVVPVEFRLPETFVGWIQLFGIYILSPTALQDITFTLRVNGGPVEGYDNQKFPPGVANFVVQNFGDIQIRIPNGGKVDVLVTNDSAAGPWVVGSKISGYYHAESEEQRIYGSL